MRRAKLEISVDILKTLAFRGPLKITQIMQKANLNCKLLKQQLGFLKEKGLVEEKIMQKRRVITVLFAITQRGITALKYFRELRQALPITEEDRKQVPLLH